MKKITLSVSFLASLFLGLCASASFESDRIRFEKNPDITLSDYEIGKMSEHVIVFVPGYMNELSRHDYFHVATEVLKTEMGIDAYTVFLSSLKNFDQNAEVLAQKVREISLKTGKKVILLGHSKGGAETTLSVIRYPDLLKKYVSRAISFEGVLSGNQLFYNLPILNFTWSIIPSDYFKKMSAHYVEKYLSGEIEKMKMERPKDYNALENKLYFIVGSKKPSEMPAPLAILAKTIAGKENLANDGLIAEKHQVLQTGKLMGRLHADHVELVSSMMSTREKQRAFTLALVKNVAKSLRGDIADFIKITKNFRAQYNPSTAVCRSLF